MRCRPSWGRSTIEKLELTSLPMLQQASALYGSVSEQRGGYDDSVVAIMVYVYETVPPDLQSAAGVTAGL